MVVVGNLTNTQSKVIPHQHLKQDILDFPTDVSYFDNDAGYITKSVNDLENYYKKSETYTQDEVDDAISAAVSAVYRFKGSVEDLDSLPTSGMVVGDVYDVRSDFTIDGDDYPAGTDVAWTGEKWNPLGGELDLSNYYTKDEIDERVADAAYTKTEINTMTGLDDATASFVGVRATVDAETKQITPADVENTTIDNALTNDADTIKKIISSYNALENRVDTAESSIGSVEVDLTHIYTKDDINSMTGLDTAEAGFVSNTLTEGDDGKIAIVNNTGRTISQAESDNKGAIEVLANAHGNLVDRVASLEGADDEKTHWDSLVMSGTETTKNISFVTSTSVVIPTYSKEPNGHIKLYVDNGKVRVTSTAAESSLTVYLCIIKNPLA